MICMEILQEAFKSLFVHNWNDLLSLLEEVFIAIKIESFSYLANRSQYLKIFVVLVGGTNYHAIAFEAAHRSRF